MGTFGTGISDNDIYLDLEIEFFDLYNEGIDVQTISETIIKNHNESFDSDEDSNDFWLALADFQWKCKSLDKKVFEKVSKIVNSKSDLLLWEELDASEEDILEREEKLNEFLLKISVPKKSAKRRIKKKLYNSVFKKGDVIIYKLENGNYGGALVIYDENNTEFGLNQLILTDLNSKNKPNLKAFYEVNIQYREEKLLNGKTNFHPMILFFYGNFFSSEFKKEYQFEIIDNIEISNFNIEYRKGYCNWEQLISIPSYNKNAIKLNKWFVRENWFQKIVKLIKL